MNSYPTDLASSQGRHNTTRSFLGDMADASHRPGGRMGAMLEATERRGGIGAMLEETLRRKRAKERASAALGGLRRRAAQAGRAAAGRAAARAALGRAARGALGILGDLPLEDLAGALWPGDGAQYIPPGGSILEHRCVDGDNEGPSSLLYSGCGNPRTIIQATYNNSIPRNQITDLGNGFVRRRWSMFRNKIVSGGFYLAWQASQWHKDSLATDPNPVHPPVYKWLPKVLPRNPNPRRYPKPNVDRGPKEQPKYREQYYEIFVEPAPAPGAKPVPKLKKGRDGGPPAPHRPHERKVYSYPWWMGLVLELTEVNDFIESVWKALPSDCRTSRGALGKMADLAACWERIDPEAAIENLVANAIEDAIAGRVSGAVTRAGRNIPGSNYGTGTPGFGFRVGSAL